MRTDYGITRGQRRAMRQTTDLTGSQKRLLYPTNRLGNGICSNGVNQSDLQRFLGVDFFGGDEHLQCASLANQTRQTLCATPPCDESKRGPSVSKNGVRRG